MIERAECFEMRPKDRDYNKKGKKREAQMEVLGGAYATRCGRNSCTACSYGRAMMAVDKVTLAGSLRKYGFRQADNVYSVNGVAPTVLAYNGGQIGHQINILEEENGKKSD